jgi:hypothetical protein
MWNISQIKPIEMVMINTDGQAAVKPIIIGVRPNKECPDKSVWVITIRPVRLSNKISPAF